nr:hypothetical protein [uncultured Sphingomonas sp.]
MVGAAFLLAAAVSAPGPFVLVNRAGAVLESIAMRPADGTVGWRSLAPGSLPAGARASMPSPGGQLCAFDLRGRINGAEVTWTSVNLCDVRTVTLNRRSDGTLWVDYD